MRHLGQVLIGAGLMGLLAAPAMTTDPTSKAAPSDRTVFQPSHGAATCGDRCLMQLSRDRASASADVAQAIQSNPVGAQDTERLEQRNKEIVRQSPFWTCKSSTTCGQEFHRGTSVGRHIAELEGLPQL